MDRKTLAIVAAAHLVALLVWHGVARADSPHGPGTSTLEMPLPTAAKQGLTAPAVQCPCVSCDLDANGRPSTYADWRVLLDGFGKATKDDGYSPRADFNRDGIISGADWATMASCCSPPTGGK